MLRIPGHCNGNPETTVLAHIRRAGLGGMGLKPPDICGVFACNGPGSCHDVIDGRARTEFSKLELDSFILEGHLRTLVWWERNGYIKY